MQKVNLVTVCNKHINMVEKQPVLRLSIGKNEAEDVGLEETASGLANPILFRILVFDDDTCLEMTGCVPV